MTFILTRIDVGDFDRWKPMFDADQPQARAAALGHRLLRNVDNPGEVFIEIAFASRTDALTARERLVASGVLDRFPDRHGPTVVEQVEPVGSRESRET